MKINWNEVTGYLLVAAASSFWGGSASLGKTLMGRGLATAQLMQARSVLSAACIILLLLVFSRKHLRISAKDLPGFVLLGIPGLALVNVSYYYAVRLLPIAIAIFVQFSAPFLIFLYGLLARTERVTAPKVTALVFSIAGTYFMVGMQDRAMGGLPLKGLVSAVISMVAYAFYVIISKRMGQKYTSWTLIAYGYGIASVFWCLLRNPFETASFLSSSGLWPATCLFAVLATLIPFSLFLLGLRRISPTGASIVSTTETVTATTFAFLFLGESLSPGQILGGILILAAVFALILQSREMPVLVED